MVHRRVNGEGTIYRRKDGRYELALCVPTTSGIRKRIRAYASSRSEADEKLAELKVRLQQGSPMPANNWRLAPYLDYWLDEVVRPNRRPATYEKYEVISRLYLQTGLGTVSLNRLTIPLVQSYLNELHRKGQSVANLYEIRKVLSAALTHAMKEELLGRNVARLIDLPGHSSPEIEPWSFSEASQFLAAARSDPLYPAFMLSLLYGLRRGEVLGLRWRDIDFVKGVLSVRQQLQRHMGSLMIGPTKTKGSARDLRLRPDARDELLQHRKVQQRRKARACSAWQPGDEEHELVFTTRTGRPIEPRNYVRSFDRICSQYQIRRIRVHDMRHTLATLADQAAVSPKDVQFTLGHTKLSTTVGTYQHASLASSERVIAQMETMIRRQQDNGDRPRVASEESVNGRRFRWRSRQILPSTSHIDMRNFAIIPGAVFGIRTRDPFLTISESGDLWRRVKVLDGAIDEWRRLWLVGLVAVSVAVKTERSIE